MKNFATIFQFQKHFNTDEKCRKFLEEQRWGNEPACPHCGSTNVCRFATDKRIFKCREKECRKKFSVTVGTIYEHTKIPLTKWFLASYILTNHSKGISSLQLAGWLGVTQKTAWFLNHRIREMLIDKEPELLSGIVEVDETYVGGKISNKHVSKRKDFNALDNKTMVFGAVAREGKLITKIVSDTTADSLVSAVTESVAEGSIMVSDENVSYARLSKAYRHAKVNHSAGEYVRGAAHTNTIEGAWSLLKRQITGIHHSVSPQHLQRYCNESTFRYNQKGEAQDERFRHSITNCEGRLNKRYKHREVVGNRNPISVNFDRMKDQISLDRIKTAHPAVRQNLTELYDEICDALKGRAICRLAYVARTFAEQAALYAKGRTAPGPRVTNAKPGYSYHNYGLAFDIVLIKDTDGNGTFDKASWETNVDFDGDGKADWAEVVHLAKVFGWEWGGDWPSFPDKPHFQKTFGYTCRDLLLKKNAGQVDGEGFVKL